MNQEKANNEMDNENKLKAGYKYENLSTRSWEDSCWDYLTLPLLPDLNIQRRTIGRKDLPLNDSLVNTVTYYYVRG